MDMQRAVKLIAETFEVSESVIRVSADPARNSVDLSLVIPSMVERAAYHKMHRVKAYLASWYPACNADLVYNSVVFFTVSTLVGEKTISVNELLNDLADVSRESRIGLGASIRRDALELEIDVTSMVSMLGNTEPFVTRLRQLGVTHETYIRNVRYSKPCGKIAVIVVKTNTSALIPVQQAA